VHIETKNPDCALLCREEASDQAKERAFARAIEAEEHAKAGAPYAEGNIVQSLALAIAMAHACNVQRRRDYARVLAARGFWIRRGKTHWSAIATPQGKEPTGI